MFFAKISKNRNICIPTMTESDMPILDELVDFKTKPDLDICVA